MAWSQTNVMVIDRVGLLKRLEILNGFLHLCSLLSKDDGSDVAE